MGLDRQGTKVKPTYSGSILTLVVLVVVISYGIQKARDLISMNNVNVSEAVDTFYFKDEDPFTAKQGLQISVAFIDLDSNEIILDRSYGEIVYVRDEWEI